MIEAGGVVIRHIHGDDSPDMHVLDVGCGIGTRAWNLHRNLEAKRVRLIETVAVKPSAWRSSGRRAVAVRWPCGGREVAVRWP